MSIGINAGQLVFVDTQSVGGAAGVIAFSGVVKASQSLLTQQTQLERLALI